MKVIFYCIVFTSAGIYIASKNPELASQAMPYIESVISWIKSIFTGLGGGND